MSFLKDLFSTNRRFNITYAMLLVAAVSLPLTTFLMLPIAILLLLNTLTEWNWREKWHNIQQHKAVPAFFFFIGIYLIPIIGFFFSYDKIRALNTFDCYLWFLTVPLVLFTQPAELFTTRRIRAVLHLFAISTILHACILLVVATYHLITTGDSSSFYYIKLSFLRHPSYVAMYSTFTFFLLLYFIHHYKKHLSKTLTAVVVISLILLGILIVFLQSKAGLLVFALLALVWAVYLIWHAQHRLLWSIGVLIVATGSVLLVMKTDILPVNRIQETVTQVKHHKSNPYGRGSSQIRLTVWKSALEIIKKNLPWGVGTGDATDELNLNAMHQNYTNLIGHHFNAHNQYLQTLLMVGIPGMILLLLYCFYPLYFSLRKRSILYGSFAVILIFNILVESMFEIRAGVDFFAIFNVLLWMLAAKRQ